MCTFVVSPERPYGIVYAYSGFFKPTRDMEQALKE
jgi:hypothetical protein